LSVGECLCLDGYYDYIREKKCLECHKTCKTCDGPSENECIICEDKE